MTNAAIIVCEAVFRAKTKAGELGNPAHPPFFGALSRVWKDLTAARNARLVAGRLRNKGRNRRRFFQTQ